MPGETQYISSTTGSHGYGGQGGPPGMKYSRAQARSELHLHTVPHEKYKGIRYRPELGRYISEIRPAQPRKRKIWLGTYKTAEEAARAFDAGIFYTKKSITYNFEDSPTILEPLPANLSPEEEHVEIQKKAKAAAALAQPTDQHPPTEAETKHLVTKSYSYVTATHHHHHRHGGYHHYDHEGENRHLPYRHEIPREIQFSAVLNR